MYIVSPGRYIPEKASNPPICIKAEGIRRKKTIRADESAVYKRCVNESKDHQNEQDFV